MTLTSVPGKAEGGFIFLRGLLAFFIVVLCFSVLIGGFTIFSHRSAVLLERSEAEIQSRNEKVTDILK